MANGVNIDLIPVSRDCANRGLFNTLSLSLYLPHLLNTTAHEVNQS